MTLKIRRLKKREIFIARRRCIGILRMTFGVAWAVAAWLKWQPAFIGGFAATIRGAVEGQPHVVQTWIGFWLTIININPTLFAVLEATVETLLALCFLLGLFTNMACVVGTLLSLGIWAIPEGFGGPYVMGQSTDIGTAFPYIILCSLLLCVDAGRCYGLDNLLASRWKRLPFSAKANVVKKVVKKVVKEEEKVPSFVGGHKKQL